MICMYVLNHWSKTDETKQIMNYDLSAETSILEKRLSCQIKQDFCKILSFFRNFVCPSNQKANNRSFFFHLVWWMPAKAKHDCGLIWFSYSWKKTKERRSVFFFFFVCEWNLYFVKFPLTNWNGWQELK
jgi:hypothetical protein